MYTYWCNSDDPTVVKKRMEHIYSLDEKSVLRRSQENPAIKKVYEEFLGEANGHKAHELLHTHYHSRKNRQDD